jgi:hypothetical protein
MLMNKRRIIAATTIILIAISLGVAGTLWGERAGSNLYTYPISVGEKTYTITVVTNWNPMPKVDLSNSTLSDLKYVDVDFIGSARKTVFFKITIPTDLLWGNISLIWKYYEQNPDRYTLSNNGTYNSVQMTFTHMAMDEHFEIRGTEASW